jgi:chloride channel, nucleotide-sensitive, 1A
MPPTIIRSPPALDSFVSLEDHQSHTPESFFGAKPVLHYHVAGALALTSSDQTSKLPVFRSADAASHGGNSDAESSTAGQVSVVEGQGSAVEAVDVYVSSE